MRRVGTWIDSESVRHYQTVIYLAYMCAGAQTLAIGSPPGPVARVLGGPAGAAWTWMLILCPLLTFVGMGWRKSVGGLWVQLAGDLGVAFASAAYVCAVAQTTWASRATFAAWVVGSLTLCALAIVARGARKIVAVTSAIKRMDAGD